MGDSNAVQPEFEQAEVLNAQFKDAFNKNEQVPLLCRSHSFMLDDIVVSSERVTKLHQRHIQRLNPSNMSKAIHPRVIKELATELGPVFAHLFLQSLESGEISKEWPIRLTRLCKSMDFHSCNNWYQ